MVGFGVSFVRHVSVCIAVTGCAAEVHPEPQFDWAGIFSAVDLDSSSYSYHFDSTSSDGKKIVVLLGRSCAGGGANQDQADAERWIWGMRLGGSTAMQYEISSDRSAVAGKAAAWLTNGDNSFDYGAVEGVVRIDSVALDLAEWRQGKPLRGHAKAVFTKLPITSGSCQGAVTTQPSQTTSSFICTCSNAGGEEWTCETTNGNCCLDNAQGEIAFERDFTALPCADLCSFATGNEALARRCEELYP